MTRRWLLLFLLLLAPAPTLADDLAADVSAHVVKVTTGFTGADLVVFGSMDVPADVAVVLEGPLAEAVVRQKSRPFGVWVNTDNLSFDHVPGYYAIATSRPAAVLVPPSILAANGLGLDQVAFQAHKGDTAKTAIFREALLANRKSKSLYVEHPMGVRILDDKLFRANFFLPAYAPIGVYTAHVYLLRGGKVLAAEVLPISVDETGLSATLNESAHFYPLTYAFGALLMAIAMGGGGAWIFGRMS